MDTKKEGPAATCWTFLLSGATKQTRTADTLITNQALYHLSYSGPQFCGVYIRNGVKKQYQSGHSVLKTTAVLNDANRREHVG